MKKKCCRILYIEKPAGIGGSVISLYELVRGLDKNRYEPVVLFYDPHPYRKRFQDLGVETIVLNNRLPIVSAIPKPPRDIAATLDRYGTWLANGYRVAKQLYLLTRQDWPAAQRVARLIRAQEIDLVHHNNTLVGNRATVLATHMAGVPQICHIRMLHPFSFIERYLARSVNAFIYISTAVEHLYRRLGIPAHKGRVIHNPIDIEAFCQDNHNAALRAEFGLTGQDWLVSNVGRLDWWKGQDYFIQALAQVIQVQPNVKALIVGAAGPDSRDRVYYQNLQQLVRDLHLAEHIIFTGFRTDIPQIMAASDIIVHSASEPEPLGRVIIEGMAAARPVIATAAGGVLDIIEDRVTGLLIPPKDATQMAGAIHYLLQNREQALAMAQQAREESKARFSPERHVVAVQQLYQEILTSF